jgi:hypothetical protein
MRTLLDKLEVVNEKLNEELEDSHGDTDKMRTVFEKRIEYDLYKRFLKDDNLTDRIDRLTVENKRMDGEPPPKSNKRWSYVADLRELTRRVHRLEKAAQLEQCLTIYKR